MFSIPRGIAVPDRAHRHGNAPWPWVASPSVSIKYYAHFLVDEPDPRGLQEYRGVVELDALPRRTGRELREAAHIIARNMGRQMRDVKVLQWARLH
jgi:hypothetical protein